jgi:hypothetical protein
MASERSNSAVSERPDRFCPGAADQGGASCDQICISVR